MAYVTTGAYLFGDGGFKSSMSAVTRNLIICVVVVTLAWVAHERKGVPGAAAVLVVATIGVHWWIAPQDSDKEQ